MVGNYNMKLIIKLSIYILVIIFPVFAFAQGANLNTVIINIARLIQDAIIPIVIGLGLLVFLWGVMKYGMARDDATRKESIAVITNGIIILFVMVSVWGLVWLFASFFGVKITGQVTLPDKQIQSESLIIKK